MKNIKTLSALLLLTASLSSKAQIQIGSNEIATMNRAGSIGKSEMQKLKQATTLFTLQYKDYKQQAQFEEAIKAVWTVTPYKIIKPDELNSYFNKEGYAIFSFGGFMISRGGSAPAATNMHLAYDLWMPEVKKNGNINKQFFSRILIYPDNETFFTAMNNINKRKDDFSAKMISFLYNDAIIYNWSPGLLQGYLKKVNDNLSKHEERGPYAEEVNKQALQSLRNDTLYVPDYVNIKFNMFSGAEKASDNEQDEELKRAYPFPIKIVTAKQLDELILNKAKPIKYLVYTKSSTDKYINVYYSGTGVKLAYNFKNKDLSKLAKVID